MASSPESHDVWYQTSGPGSVIQDGDLRSRLQPIMFAELTEKAQFGGSFYKGTPVALQYWGSGNVRVTLIAPPHTAITVKAHDLNGAILL